jgi:hypothetical protein
MVGNPSLSNYGSVAGITILVVSSGNQNLSSFCNSAKLATLRMYTAPPRDLGISHAKGSTAKARFHLFLTTAPSIYTSNSGRNKVYFTVTVRPDSWLGIPRIQRFQVTYRQGSKGACTRCRTICTKATS